MRTIIFVLLISLFTSLLSTQTMASTSEWKVLDEAKSRLIIGDNGSEDGRQFLWVGLEFDMADGWKTYWRHSGDSGMAVQPNFSNSENVAESKIVWPAPKRYIDFDVLESYGYKEHFVLPIKLYLEDIGKPTIVDVAVKYAVCNENCIFVDHQHKARVSDTTTSSQTLIKPYLDRVPQKLAASAMSISNITHLSGNKLTITVQSKEPMEELDVFVEAGDNFRFPKPDVMYLNPPKTLAQVSFDYEKLLDGAILGLQPVMLTLVTKDMAAEELVSLPKALPMSAKTNQIVSKPVEQANYSIWFMLFAAFLGGLILNIMPCVLPVLSLKVMGVLKKTGHEEQVIRRGFLLSAAGIITSFFVLALIIIGLQQGGMSVGWGFHFQEPLFVVGVILILNLFAANEWGLFEIHMPQWLGGKANDLLDQKHNSPMGHFLTGAFATLLATPCTAPFLGTAVSFALSHGIWQIILIFVVMGFGLATPYLLFSAVPKLVTLLPKPGNWMRKVQKLLGLLLFATSLWLMFVLWNQVALPMSLLLILLTIMPIVGLTLLKHKKKSLRRIMLWGTVLLLVLLPKPMASYMQESDYEWQAFEPHKISDYVDEGKIVFVDVTADWCLTCKFNKLNVLSRPEIKVLMQSSQVIAMKADYTQPSEVITNYLRKNGRYGIPFNAVYGPKMEQGVLLPELLTLDEVLAAFKKTGY